jgi:hypothetical protein
MEKAKRETGLAKSTPSGWRRVIGFAMWRFYGRVAGQVPGILWEGVNRVVTGIALLIFLAWLLRPEWGQWLNAKWPDLPRWPAFVILGVLFLYGLLRANFRKFQTVETERDQERTALRAAEEERDTEHAARVTLLRRVELLSNRPAAPTPPPSSAFHVGPGATLKGVTMIHGSIADYHHAFDIEGTVEDLGLLNVDMAGPAAGSGGRRWRPMDRADRWREVPRTEKEAWLAWLEKQDRKKGG